MLLGTADSASPPLQSKAFRCQQENGLPDAIGKEAEEGLKPVSEEEVCIKDGYARIVVEIIKRDWPKNCPKLLLQLQILSSKGALQAELVMLILLRLSEDLVLFPTQNSGRTQTLKRMLNENVQKILYTVRYYLKDYVRTYGVLKNDAQHQAQAKTCCHVIGAALNAIASYFEWVPLWHIIDGQTKLTETLWCLMNDVELQLEASQCLLIAVKRMAAKVAPNSKPLLDLFKDSSTPYIFSSAQMAAGELLTDKHYFFMKIRCELLTILGEQLCHVMNNEGSVEIPTNFGKYLDCLLEFTSHNSKYLSFLTQNTWRMLFKHVQLSRNPLLLAVLPNYLHATRTNLVKVGFPSKNDNPSCEYSRLDFDTDEDFYQFLATYRKELKQTMDVVCKIDQRKCFEMASKYLKHQLMASNESESVDEFALDGLTCTSRLSFPEWEATTFFTKIIITNLFQNLKEEIPVQDGIELLQLALNFRAKHPLILACVHTNISTLFRFVYFKPDYFPEVLNKFLEVIEEVKVPTELSVKYVRSNACSCIHQICRTHARLILPNFGILFDYVKRLLTDKLLTQMERSKLIDAMFVVIGQLKHYDQQKALLEELMAPVVSHWQSKEIQRAFSDSEAFIKYVGADQHETFVTAEMDRNRSRIIYCLSAILGLVRWISCPDVSITAEAGGFVIGYDPSGNPVLRNPCSELVLKLLDRLFVLIRTQNNLYLPKVVAKLEDVSTSGSPLDLLEVNSMSKMGLFPNMHFIYDPPEYKTQLEKMQGFFCSLYNCCFYILGLAGTSLKHDFYSMKNLVDRILKCAFMNLRFIPDFRLLTVVHSFLKPMASSCPPEYYESVLAPILQYFLPPLYARLSDEWNRINELDLPIKEKTVPEYPNCPNVVPEQVQQLTKELMHFLHVFCGAAEFGNKNKPSDAQITDAFTIFDSENDDAQNTDAVTIVDEKHDDAQSTDDDAQSTDDDAQSTDDDSQNTDAVTIVDEKHDGDSKPNDRNDSSMQVYERYQRWQTGVTEAQRTDGVTIVDGAQITDVATIVDAEDDEVFCDSNQDADDTVYVAESDDDDSVCISDIVSSSTAAIDEAPECKPAETCSTEDACNMSMEDIDDSVMAAVKSDDACNMSMEDIDDSDVAAVESDEGEIAAEMPQPDQLMLSELLTGFSEHSKLTKLGTCLLKDENVRLILLRLAFDSLVWNVLPCQKTVKHLCWPMLKQVIFESLPVESVTYYFTTVLKVLQQMSYYKSTRNVLQRLAFQMYVSLRPRYSKLADVMKTVPHIKEFNLNEFDQRLFNPNIKKPDTCLPDYFKRLFEDCIDVTACTKSSVQVQVNTPAQPFQESKKRPPPNNVQLKNLEQQESRNIERPLKKQKTHTPQQPVMPTPVISGQFQE